MTRSESRSGEQQVELLSEQCVVVGEVVAEERKRLDERAAPGHDLGAAVRDQVDRRELLEDPDGVVGAQHADRARQSQPRRPRGDRGERDRGRRDDEVPAVVLADAEDVEPDALRELRLLEQLPHAHGRARCTELREGVDPEFHQTMMAYSPEAPRAVRTAPSTASPPGTSTGT